MPLQFMYELDLQRLTSELIQSLIQIVRISFTQNSTPPTSFEFT
jgi:hypothetical protein